MKINFKLLMYPEMKGRSNVKKIVAYVGSVFTAAVLIPSAFTLPKFVQHPADLVEASEITKYTIEDIKNLQDFLLARETPDLRGKDYDLNDDDRWDVFDLCLMKQQFLKQSSSESNVLIAYFTRAENVYLDNPDEIDIDATTSASVLLPGNSAIMANYIQSLVGGDLFSIVVEDLYPSDYESCLKQISEEQAENIHPVLKNHLTDIDDYDIIFLGYPNWGYSCPMAVYSFLEEYDFSGKTVIPFCTHGTGGLADTVSDITDSLPEDCTVLKPIGVYRSDISDCYDVIAEWLSELGMYH